jgi:hypothetical protein
VSKLWQAVIMGLAIVVGCAEVGRWTPDKLIRLSILETYRRPNLDSRNSTVFEHGHMDPLLDFTRACRKELNG